MNINIALLQFNIKWENKLENINTIKKFIKNLKKPVDIVIFPEMFSTGFSMNAEKLAEELLNKNEPTLQELLNISYKYKTAITTSWITKNNNNFYNTLHFITPEEKIYIYHKIKLFSPGNENKTYTPGNSQLIVNYKDFSLYFQICYDLRFPELARNKKLKYDIGINVANWPSVRSKHWKNLIIARAIENQAYFVGVNRTGKDANNLFYSGNSIAADFNGNILVELLAEEEIKVISLNKEKLTEYRNKFPVYKDF